MTTDLTTMALADVLPVAEADVLPAAPADVLPAAPPAAPKPKPITWETERNAAVAALGRVGATPREARVLASLASNAARAMRTKARKGSDDPSALDDKAARGVLDAHRATAVPGRTE